MQLSSSEPCMVILTEKEVEVSVNNHATFTLPKNYLAAFACNNNVIELSTLNHVLITHINRNIINDYLLFLNKNLTCVKPWSRLATPVIACHSRTPEVFRLAANHSKHHQNENTSYSQIVTECRMRYAVQMLLMDNKNITQVA